MFQGLFARGKSSPFRLDTLKVKARHSARLVASGLRADGPSLRPPLRKGSEIVVYGELHTERSRKVAPPPRRAVFRRTVAAFWNGEAVTGIVAVKAGKDPDIIKGGTWTARMFLRNYAS